MQFVTLFKFFLQKNEIAPNISVKFIYVHV